MRQLGAALWNTAAQALSALNVLPPGPPEPEDPEPAPAARTAPPASAAEFVARLLVQIPPKGQKRVNYYGLYSNKVRGKWKKFGYRPRKRKSRKAPAGWIGVTFCPSAISFFSLHFTQQPILAMDILLGLGGCPDGKCRMSEPITQEDRGARRNTSS